MDTLSDCMVGIGKRLILKGTTALPYRGSYASLSLLLVTELLEGVAVWF